MKTKILLVSCLLPFGAVLGVQADPASSATETTTVVLSNPLPGGRLLSGFGSRQSVLGSAKHHPGVDLASLEGVPVIAPADGVVMLATSADERPGKGAMLILDHSPELKTFFNHMGALVVEVGQKIERGDVLGYPRDAGDMAGPHIHFEVVDNGKQVDPALWIDELLDREAENQEVAEGGGDESDS